MNERQEERLEPSLEREGAGGRWRSALATLATEGTQETLLKEQEGVGDDGDPAAPAANNKQAEPANMSAGRACK